MARRWQDDPELEHDVESPPCDLCRATSTVWVGNDGPERNLCSPCFERMYPENVRRVPMEAAA